MWLWVLIAILAVVLISVVSCVAVVGSAVNEAAKEAAPVGGSTAGAPTSQSSGTNTSDSSADDDSPSLNDAYTWDDGVRAELTKIKTQKISDDAAGGRPGEPMIVFTLKVTNKSAQNLDGDLVSVKVTYGEDGTNADQVYDIGNYNDQISGTIKKGKSKSGDYGFAVPKKGQKDVRIEVAPGFDYDSVTFEGAVK